MHVGLCGPLPPPYGGMANQLNQLHALLLAENIQVSLLPTNAPYAISVLSKIKGIRALVRLLPYFIHVWRFAAQVDVLHVFANSGWSWQLFSAPILWAGWLRGTPVIVNYRGGEARQYFTQSIRWVRPSMNKATVVVVPSAYLQAVFADFGMSTTIIPNIIDLGRFKPKPLSTMPRKRLHVVITRNLEVIYGISTAIQAIALLRQEIPDITLSIAGSGPQLQMLQQLVIEKNLEQQVNFTGKLTPEAVAQLYQHADLMLNPTTVDNMPNSLLEAMASGIPIVTTAVGGIPYVVEHNKTALFAEVNNPESMATQILRLWREPGLYERLVANGLQEIQQYAWPQVKMHWLNLYAATQGQQ